METERMGSLQRDAYQETDGSVRRDIKEGRCHLQEGCENQEMKSDRREDGVCREKQRLTM